MKKDAHPRDRLFFCVTRTPDYAPGFCTRMVALVDDSDSVDQDVTHSDRKLVGILERRSVAHRIGIEYGDVSKEAFTKEPAVFDEQPVGNG